MWILLACGSAIFAGVTAILAKCGIKNTDSTVATALRTIVVLIFSWIMVFVANTEMQLAEIDNRTIIYLVLSGLATGASWLCYFKALQCGDVNKVTPIDKSSTVLTIILALLIFGENIAVTTIIAIIAIAIGTLLMIKRQNSDTVPTSNSYIWYACGSAVFASLTAILGKIGMQNIDSTLGTAIRTIVVLIMAWVVVFARNKQHTIADIDKKSWLFIMLSGVSTGASWLCYFAALKTGVVSVVVPIDKLSIIVTILFSYIVLKEKLSKKALMGLLLIVGGTLLMLV